MAPYHYWCVDSLGWIASRIDYCFLQLQGFISQHKTTSDLRDQNVLALLARDPDSLYPRIGWICTRTCSCVVGESWEPEAKKNENGCFAGSCGLIGSCLFPKESTSIYIFGDHFASKVTCKKCSNSSRWCQDNNFSNVLFLGSWTLNP